MLQIEADILKTLASLTVKKEFTSILKPQNNQEPDKKIKHVAEFQNTF